MTQPRFERPVGINPAQPDPLGGRGLPGLGRQAGSQTQQSAAPQGLGLPGLGGGTVNPPPQPNLPDPNSAAVRLQNIGADITGGQRRSDQIFQQRQQMYEKARQAYLANIGVLGAFSGLVQKARPGQQDQVIKQLRDAYAKLAPGGEGLFDATVGNSGVGPGILQSAAKDEGAKALLANGATGKQLVEYLTSPEKIEEAKRIQDQKVLPSVQDKIARMLQSKDPEMRKRLAEVQSDGKITSAEIASLNELGTDGPEGTRLLPMELDTLNRKQDEVAQFFPDLFATTEEFKKERLLRMAEQSAARQARTEAQIEAEAAEAEGPAAPKLSDIGGVRKEFSAQSKDFVKVRDAAGRVNAAAKDPSAAGDLALIFNYMKILDPGSVVRESEFATAQNSAGVPDRVRAQYNNILRGERLAPETRKDFVNKAASLFESQVKSQLQLESEYTRIAREQGIEPSKVVVDYLGELRQGVQGDPPTVDGEVKVGGDSPEGFGPRSKGKPKTIQQNGFTYTLNEKTGEYE